MKKTIIILGEQYWFDDVVEKIQGSKYITKYVLNKNDKRFNYVLLKNPGELIETINRVKPENIRALFLFQDTLTDSYLNNKKIVGMKRYLLDLIKYNNIFVYPPPDVIDNFGSKRYNKTLIDKLEWAQLPGTRVLKIENYHPNKENNIIEDLWKIVNEMWKEHEVVVVKKGYSYNGTQVLKFNKNVTKTYNEFKEKAQKLNKKYFWGKARSAIPHEINVDRYYIIQGYNKIVAHGSNEYRIFFHNGKAKYIANGSNIPNTCLEDQSKKPLLKEIIKFAKKLYPEYLKIFWPLERKPILFRIDVSYAVDPIFQDKYSIKVNDELVRMYANEMEIDPTSFFYNKFICESIPDFTSKKLQINMAKYIRKYIHTLSE
jgi:ribosomal protein S17E